MADDELPPANLILQALHGITRAIKDMDGRFAAIDGRLVDMRGDIQGLREEQAETNRRLDSLEKRTTKGFLETNTKLAALTKTVADLGKTVEKHDKQIDHLLREGLGAEVRSLRVRMDRFESSRRTTKKKPRRH